MANIATMTIQLPADLRERAGAVAKRLRSPVVILIRESLREKVEHYENKFREEKARAQADRAARRLQPLPAIGSRGDGLAPKRPGEEEAVVEHAPSARALEQVLDTQAKHIFAAINSPTERRLRAIEALAEIRKRAPLTCPESDREILELLEDRVLRMRELAPAPPDKTPPQEEEEEEERTIDPDLIRTRGDVPRPAKTERKK